MSRIAWLTDLHLNFLRPAAVEAFWRSVADSPADVILIGGDIGDAPRLLDDLHLIKTTLARPVYFVLGNHDYYHGSITLMRELVTELAAHADHLIYLSIAPDPISLTPDTALVGHGGWGDGRLGDYANSWVMLNDHVLIGELTGLSKADLLDQLNRLGDEAAAHIADVLPRALAVHRRVIVLTHVPPFKGACWHEGQISDDNFLPHFTCKAVGDTLVAIMADQPADKELLVLCGHTHGSGDVQIQPNIRVITGGTEYGIPAIQQIFEF